MHLITSTARRLYASTRSEAVECSSACTCKDKVRSLALWQQGGVIDECRWGSGSFVFADQPAVDQPAAFRWHASSMKSRPSWYLFLFRMAPVLPLRTAWIADILLQASLSDVQRHAVGNVVAETCRDLVFGTTARLSNLSMLLKGEVRLSPEPYARTSAEADSAERKVVRRAYSRRALDCEKTTVLWKLCFLPSWSTLPFNPLRTH